MVTCEKKLCFELLETGNQLQNTTMIKKKIKAFKHWDLDKKGELRALAHT